MNGATGKQRTTTGSRASGAQTPGAQTTGAAMPGAMGSMSDEKKSETRGSKASESRVKSTMSKASDLASQAADTMLHAASDSASSISHQVTGILDRQVGNGADMIHQVANSTRVAADDMTRKMPQIAGMVRSVADRIDDYAEGMRDKTVDQMVAGAADFTRRQPAAVFGLAALAGFLMFRAVGNMPLSAESEPSRDGWQEPSDG